MINKTIVIEYCWVYEHFSVPHVTMKHILLENPPNHGHLQDNTPLSSINVDMNLRVNEHFSWQVFMLF